MPASRAARSIRSFSFVLCAGKHPCCSAIVFYGTASFYTHTRQGKGSTRERMSHPKPGEEILELHGLCSARFAGCDDNNGFTQTSQAPTPPMP